ncbi:MAG: Lrp/AsnC family transcriptional regulator [Candidatus Micrarchaeota archaeon]|nr:Lrp/AsnC family transcriptional regulator [Candidatus Micrarchaeota archaeon]
MSINIDEKDTLILEALKEDSHSSIQKIAKRTGIPPVTVHNRIKKLRSEGVIEKYTIKINKAKLGRAMSAYVLIKATPKSDHIGLLEKIIKHELAEDGSAITGEFDLIIKIRVKDVDELNLFTLKFLRTFDEVSQTQTMIAFKNVEKY